MPQHTHMHWGQVLDVGIGVRPWQSSGQAKAPDSGGQRETGWELQVTQVQVGSCQDGPSQALWGP